MAKRLRGLAALAQLGSQHQLWSAHKPTTAVPGDLIWCPLLASLDMHTCVHVCSHKLQNLLIRYCLFPKYLADPTKIKLHLIPVNLSVCVRVQ